MRHQRALATRLFAPLTAIGFAASAMLTSGCVPEDVFIESGGDQGVDADMDASLGPDLVGTSTMSVRFDPDGESFWDFPWPSDARLSDEGYVDLTGFPRATDAFVRIFVTAIQENVQGFSTMPVTYVAFSTPLPSEASAPTPIETLRPASPVQLLDISPEGCGDRVPIEVRLSDREDSFMEPDTLIAAPLPGFVLRPATTYALVVQTHFGFEDNMSVETPDALRDALSGQGDLASLYAPLVDCLPDAGLSAARIGAATVFTTQDPLRDLIALRAHVVDPGSTDSPEVSDWRLTESATVEGNYVSYRGTFAGPIYQTGTSPYASSGGRLEFEADGTPIVQRLEDIPFMITFPDDVDGPFPVLIWEDGTGADLESHITSNVTQRALNNGFAIATFEAQFHGERATPGSDPELHTFNYLNPHSFRSNFQQQVVDTAYFIRLLRETVPSLNGLPGLDTNTLVYAGQSQGAIVGAITAGVETEIDAYALNGIGGYLSITMVERQDPIDINDQIRRLMRLSEPLDRFHALVAITQLGGDVADPINYGPRWRGWDGHETGNHVFLINGRLDHTTPERSINAITVAGRTTPVEPAGWDVDPFGVIDLGDNALPVSGNAVAFDGSTELTISTFLDAAQGHFTIYRNDEARALAIEFLRSALDGTPVIREP